MKGMRLAAALLCALLMLSLPVMADGFGMGDFDSDTVNKNPQVDNPKEVTPTPSTELPQEPTGDGAGNNAGDAVGTDGAGTENGNSSQRDDGLWGDWKDPGNSGVRTELPSEAQQELEQKQQQREEAFREAERENAALPEEEEEKQKKPTGGKAADAAPTELVLPQREARTGSPVRYILIGALLAGALCIAIYLFTHPAREDDPADETKS